MGARKVPRTFFLSKTLKVKRSIGYASEV